MTTITKPYMTTGEIARLVGVAPRTVTQWIDKGGEDALPCIRVGHNLKQGKARRVLRSDFLAFARKNQLTAAVKALESPMRRVLVLADAHSELTPLAQLLPAAAYAVIFVEGGFDLGLLIGREGPPDLLVIDDSAGIREPARRVADYLARLPEWKGRPILSILAEDHPVPAVLPDKRLRRPRALPFIVQEIECLLAAE